jgi:hypothetical protein
MRTIPLFPDEFTDYLLANGWDRQDGNCEWITFWTKDRLLIIKGDAIDLMDWNGDATGRPCWKLTASYTGWSALTVFTWMLLLHCMDIVPFKHFVSRVKRDLPPGALLAEQLLQHFRISESAPQLGVPEAY